MKTYTVEVTRITRDYFSKALLENIPPIRATSDADAEHQLYSMLGLSVTPCCYSEDGPCERCKKDASDKVADRAGDAQDNADHERECREGR